jgi:NAD dependent epimerase/dehydratase family enzyme
MRILISGSSGMVGTAASQLLTENGHTVSRLLRHQSKGKIIEAAPVEKLPTDASPIDPQEIDKPSIDAPAEEPVEEPIEEPAERPLGSHRK